MKRFLCMTAMLVAPAVALADKTYDTSITSLPSIATPGVGTRAADYGIGFENIEGFSPGDIFAQGGFSTFSGDLNQMVMNTNPAAGSQHYRNGMEAGKSAGSLVGAFSPDTGDFANEHQSVSIDLFISNTGGADYDVVPQAPSQALLSARVKFSFLGNIMILDDTGGGLGFVDTGVAWTPGQYKNLTIDLDGTGSSIDYFYDGAMIYSSVAGVYAGTAVEQVVLLSDNFHLDGEFGDFDNLAVTTVPEPGTLLAIGLGALALVRRRF